ncbi:MAG TPA: hypothetical protein VKI19_05790 [Acidimicrobiales bacterium]|nr:hypothetical protein [Acidimicrobiales bacterium]
MAAFRNVLGAVAVALLGIGAIGVATHDSGRPEGGRAATATTRRPGPAPTPPDRTPTTPPTTVAGPPPPGPAQLEAGLVTPTDMGGYYRVSADAASALIDSAPCLAVLQPSSAQAGRAVTALLGPDLHSVPTIVEEVASYRGGAAPSVYRSVRTALDACRSLAVQFTGAPALIRLQPSSVPPVGDADRAWSGTFTSSGDRFTFQVGVVLTGPDVLAVIWVDSVPGSDPVMGNFVSTLSLAIGKLA